MRRSAGPLRLLWQFTALFQLVLPLLLSAADVRLEREAANARAFAHVEANTGQDCARVHMADCALCQHLTTPQARAHKPALPLDEARGEPPAVAFQAVSVTSPDEQPSLARAPPTA